MREIADQSLEALMEMFRQAPTQVLQEFVQELDEHPLFRSFLPQERREFRRRAQLELSKRHDSMVTRWVRAGGSVEYDDEFHLVLLGTPEFARDVMHGLGLPL